MPPPMPARRFTTQNTGVGMAMFAARAKQMTGTASENTASTASAGALKSVNDGRFARIWQMR